MARSRYDIQDARAERRVRNHDMAACLLLHLRDLARAYPDDRAASGARQRLQGIAASRNTERTGASA